MSTIDDGRVDATLRYARMDFLHTLAKQAEKEPLVVGKEYEFQHRTGIGSHVTLRRKATQADIDLVLTAVANRDLSSLAVEEE